MAAGRVRVNDGSDDRVTSIANQIEGYLQKNPSAADSAEGIQRWWIQGWEVSLDLVQQALDRLQAQGIIERTTIGGTTIYRRTRHGG